MGDRILIVDDSRPFRKSLMRFFTMEGYDVVEAEDGPTGLEQYQRYLPDLVVMDVNMPCMDGFETVRRLRESSVVPVLMLSCRSAEMDRVLGLTSGADCYLAKPFSANELLSRVDALLRQRRGTQGRRSRRPAAPRSLRPKPRRREGPAPAPRSRSC